MVWAVFCQPDWMPVMLMVGGVVSTPVTVTVYSAALPTVSVTFTV